MTNKEAIRVLEQIKKHPTLQVYLPDEYEALDLAIKALEGEWIPANERLPDDMQRVLIWFEYYRYGDFNCMYQTYGFGYVCDGKWSPFINGETGWQDYSIIAWQPLPKPYRKERKDVESST